MANLNNKNIRYLKLDFMKKIVINKSYYKNIEGHKYCKCNELFNNNDVNNNDTKSELYKVSNNTRINMKNLKRFVFQSFNNNIDGILF